MASSITNTAGQFVSTVDPVLSLTGEGSITTLAQAPGANKSYDLLFDYVFSEADAKSFLDCFTVSGKGATFAATLDSDAAFEALIVKCIDDATLTTISDSGKATATPAGDAGLKMNPWFRKRVIDNIRRIYEDQVPNILQSNWSLTTAVGAAGGAASLSGLLSDAEVETIAQMLPRSNYELYADASENPITSALPLVKADKLVFVFNTTLTAISRVYSPSAGATTNTTSPAGNPYSALGDYYQDFSSETRNIALRIQMATGEGAFTGLKAPVAGSLDGPHA